MNRSRSSRAVLAALILAVGVVGAAEEPTKPVPQAWRDTKATVRDDAKAVGVAVKRDTKVVVTAVKRGAQGIAVASKQAAQEVAAAARKGASKVKSTFKSYDPH